MEAHKLHVKSWRWCLLCVDTNGLNQPCLIWLHDEGQDWDCSQLSDPNVVNGDKHGCHYWLKCGGLFPILAIINKRGYESWKRTKKKRVRELRVWKKFELSIAYFLANEINSSMDVCQLSNYVKQCVVFRKQSKILANNR